MRRTLLLVTLLSAAVSAAATGNTSGNGDLVLNPDIHAQGALTDASPQRRQSMLTVFLGLPYGRFGWGYGFPLGVGARYYLPLVHDGFIPSINDSFGLEVGADVSLINGSAWVPFLLIPVEARWNLHFLPNLAGYLKVGLALEMSFSSYCFANVCRNGFGAGVEPIGAIGIMLNLTPAIALRIEAGYPWLKIGLGFPF